MKATEFNRIYNKAKTVDIINNEWFNFAGFFWINLTTKQHQKMVDLIRDQGNKPVVVDGIEWFKLKDGLRLRVTAI